jgi:transmembrane sensor
MGNEKAEELIKKYLAGTTTPEEEALLESWYIMAAQNQPDMAGEPDYPRIGEEILQPLRAEQQDLPIPAQPQPDYPATRPPIRLWPRIAAAAAVLLMVTVGSYLIVHKTPTERIAQRPTLENDLLPAGTKATLTLLDGRTIPLDSAGGQALARQGNTTLSSLNGQLIYSTNQPGQAAGVQRDRPATPTGTTAYNTLTTQPGEHYSLLLPDGTKAWLNAASSVTYPVAFDGNERKVKVTGEVYFEIVHNPKQPFRIAVKDQLVEDIGTHLNINAYDDEPATRTTLLEGSIKLTKGNASATLTPGQQATMGLNDGAFQIKSIDTDAAIAWKNGYFYFDRADITTVMRELARWYNVKVVYKGALPKGTFKGKVYRNINASEALNILAYFGAHFRIEGNTITVSA